MLDVIVGIGVEVGRGVDVAVGFGLGVGEGRVRILGVGVGIRKRLDLKAAKTELCLGNATTINVNSKIKTDPNVAILKSLCLILVLRMDRLDNLFTGPE